MANLDEWDDYSASRKRTLAALATRPNPATFSGDIHSTWVHDLQPDVDDTSIRVAALSMSARRSRRPSSRLTRSSVGQQPVQLSHKILQRHPSWICALDGDPAHAHHRYPGCQHDFGINVPRVDVGIICHRTRTPGCGSGLTEDPTLEGLRPSEAAVLPATSVPSLREPSASPSYTDDGKDSLSQPADGEPTPYERMGGHDTFSFLVAEFYRHVAADPVLRPLYPEADLAPAERRLLMFLEQYWGGPRTYSAERGHPRLRMRHAPYPVTERTRDAWLGAMRAAVGALPADAMDAAARTELWDYLERSAFFMVNAVDGEPASGQQSSS